MLKISLEISEANECTSFPWWVIVDPLKNMRLDVDTAAAQIEGPFFSREEAEAELKATHYNYSKRACVYCMSGYHSRQYKEAYKKAGYGSLIDRIKEVFHVNR